jgi:hypothetical protein
MGGAWSDETYTVSKGKDNSKTTGINKEIVEI